MRDVFSFVSQTRGNRNIHICVAINRGIGQLHCGYIYSCRPEKLIAGP